MSETKKSIWTDTIKIKDFPPLKSNLKTDVLVIGAGMCGILTAYMLKQEGLNVVVIDKGKVGMGITKNTTAVITAQHDTLYQDLVNDVGFDKAKQYLDANLMAITKFKKLSEKYDFDFEEVDSYIYTKEDIEKIKKEVDTLKSLGIDASFEERINLPFEIKGAVKFPNQAQMNPLKLIKELVNDLEIYEYTNASNIKKDKVFVDQYHIEAKKIIIATHFPYINHLGMYYTKMYQVRSYVVAINTNDEINGVYTNLDSNDFYFRKYQDYLFIGGNDKKTATKGVCYNNLINFVNKYYPDKEIKYQWANQDCITIDDIAYIGRYSNFNKYIYVATGFNLWGMTQSMISAVLLTDFILNRPNEYQKLYNPLRNPIKKQLFANLGSYIKNLFSFKKKRCPHMGCALIYNEVEDTWDCPCHGSRFTREGKIIDNPSTKELN